ncbi:MAG TPA: hypothetical protein VL501_04260, partial [Pyrinomonadaceae bacterium]|nr:hypothetical protein [Pyrinomonadaceae bacterium]
MKKSLILTLMFAAFAMCALAQTSTTTRPRVATTPTPPVLGNGSGQPATTQGGAPVLRGGSSHSSGQPSATPTPSVDDPNEVIKVETNLVTMPVSVLDRDGRFISGLQQRDFKIFENGIEQKID